MYSHLSGTGDFDEFLTARLANNDYTNKTKTPLFTLKFAGERLSFDIPAFVTLYVTNITFGIIRSLGYQQTQKCWEGEKVEKFQSLQKRAMRKLELLDSATSSLIEFGALPSNRFHQLTGNLKRLLLHSLKSAIPNNIPVG